MKTCLYDEHLALNAQMSPFGGFIMPISYTSIINEHNAVREAVGMFDVSHMGEIYVEGADSEKYVNYIFSNDVSNIPSGKILYGMLLHENGCVVDDLLVYKCFEQDKWLLVVNASNIAKDYEWIKKLSEGWNVLISDVSDEYAEIALQGPQAENVAVKVLDMEGIRDIEFYNYKNFEYEGNPLIISRTGYTGEDGFEIYGSPAAIVELWKRFLEAGVVPCGLGCRDTLRFEAGLPLYGHELSDEITPLEAGLGMFVKVAKEDFVGKSAILQQKGEGLTRKLVGIELFDKAIPRAGYPVLVDGVQVGEVTTGYRSISTDKSVCVAMVDKKYSEIGTKLDIAIRKKVFAGAVCKKRFYETKYKK